MSFEAEEAWVLPNLGEAVVVRLKGWAERVDRALQPDAPRVEEVPDSPPDEPDAAGPDARDAVREPIPPSGDGQLDRVPWCDIAGALFFVVGLLSEGRRVFGQFSV